MDSFERKPGKQQEGRGGRHNLLKFSANFRNRKGWGVSPQQLVHVKTERKECWVTGGKGWAGIGGGGLGKEFSWEPCPQRPYSKLSWRKGDYESGGARDASRFKPRCQRGGRAFFRHQERPKTSQGEDVVKRSTGAEEGRSRYTRKKSTWTQSIIGSRTSSVKRQTSGDL